MTQLNNRQANDNDEPLQSTTEVEIPEEGFFRGEYKDDTLSMVNPLGSNDCFEGRVDARLTLIWHRSSERCVGFRLTDIAKLKEEAQRIYGDLPEECVAQALLSIAQEIDRRPNSERRDADYDLARNVAAGTSPIRKIPRLVYIIQETA
jgi:hypothetical protein